MSAAAAAYTRTPGRSSEPMVQAATDCFQGVAHLTFQRGHAVATGLPDGAADIAFARALLHHLADRSVCLTETHRLLAPGGMYLIQERTPEDLLIAGAREHIRGYFFERFPRLIEVEVSRRRRLAEILNRLQQAGFARAQTRTFWETRQVHPNVAALAADLRARTGAVHSA